MGRPITALWCSVFVILISQDDRVNSCDIGAGDDAVAVHIAGVEIGCVIAEQIAVKCSDIGTCDISVAVNVTDDARAHAERALLVATGDFVDKVGSAGFQVVERERVSALWNASGSGKLHRYYPTLAWFNLAIC